MTKIFMLINQKRLAMISGTKSAFDDQGNIIPLKDLNFFYWQVLIKAKTDYTDW